MARGGVRSLGSSLMVELLLLDYYFDKQDDVEFHVDVYW